MFAFTTTRTTSALLFFLKACQQPYCVIVFGELVYLQQKQHYQQ